MLVLSRKIGERVVLPQCGIAITVVAVKGNMVRLGISAPADVAVYREDVWARMRQPTHSPSAGMDPQ